MIYDFDPAGIDHPESCCCPCCGFDEEDIASGIEQAEEMFDNLLKYGTIDKPKDVV